MTTDQFLQYLTRHDSLRELQPTFNGLLMRARLRYESSAPATVTVLRPAEAERPADAPAFEAAG
jgi:hypothetical protein